MRPIWGRYWLSLGSNLGRFEADLKSIVDPFGHRAGGQTLAGERMTAPSWGSILGLLGVQRIPPIIPGDPKEPQILQRTPGKSQETLGTPTESYGILLRESLEIRGYLWGPKGISETLDKGSGTVGKPKKFHQIRGNPKAS